MIPMSGPDITELEIQAVQDVLRTPVLSIGPQIEQFEQDFAGYIGSAHAIGVSSGTAGLHLAMIAAGVTDGDEVITTPFSFVASANCALYERALPVFVDIDPVTLNLDPNQVEAAITAHTRAILAVHVFGQPCDMAALQDIARRHHLFLIEDACEAIGAEYQGQKVGTFGDLATFAFYPNKQMTTGEGGMVVTESEDIRDLCRSLRNQGRDVFDEWLSHSRLGYNYRMDELSAALGVAQISRIEELLHKRQQVADAYGARLARQPMLTLPKIAPATTRMSWFVYVVRLAPELDRSALMAFLKEKGVPTRPYFPPIHLQPFYRQTFGFQPGDFPITEAVAETTLALPFYGNLSLADIDYVCEAIQQGIQQQLLRTKSIAAFV